MRVDDNKGSEVGYEPNSYGALQEQPDFREPPLKYILIAMPLMWLTVRV